MAVQANRSGPHKRGEKFMRHAMNAHGGSVYLVALAQTRSEQDAQTKRYGFAPRENFAQVYDDYLAADDEAYLAGDDARRQELADNPPSLYLITELEA